MDEAIILELAQQYLLSRKIKFIKSGKLGRINGCNQEVIFLDPLTLDPNVAVVDPEDIRVCVNIETKEVTWIEQM